ncbi:hypothetical protein HDU78_006806 [Chytriomyces hyalinus]|nr:hypothetical protein HDU78_006806 [Chytriomyces hyalinus]KAJ3265139.1 hypothetical protein HDU77_006370 [Chytriomyces hyalinus]
MSHYEQLDNLVQTRVKTLAHLQHMHSGTAFYLDTVRVTPDLLADAYDNAVSAKRCWQYKYLGLSVGGLLVIANPVEFVKALNVLLLEYENETEAKRVVIPTDLFRRRQVQPNDLSNVTATFLETGVYQYLETPDLPFDLDYSQVFMSLCDALIAAYNKLIDGTEDVCGQGYLDASKRFDALIKKIIANVYKDLENMSVMVMRNELAMFLDGKQ